jgi:hypothetical protein
MDNLSQVIQDGDVTPESYENSEEALPGGIIRQEDTSESIPDPVQEESVEIGITSLSEWFKSNNENFDNVNYVRLNVKGVDPDETLIFTISDPKGGKDKRGFDKRNIKVFENANQFPVLDLPGTTMEIYTNCFIITNDMSDAKFLKCYGVKSGLIVYFCINIEGSLIPYARTKMKKREKGVKLISADTTGILSNLAAPIDPELLILQFAQIRKSIESITTKDEAIKWFMEKREGVIDIGHLMKIENALMHLTTYG